MKIQSPTLNIIAKNVRKYRTDKDISQEKLAELANVHRNYIGHVERGERNMTVDSIERISKALGVTVIQLLS